MKYVMTIHTNGAEALADSGEEQWLHYARQAVGEWDFVERVEIARAPQQETAALDAGDPEISAMRAVAWALLGLPLEAQQRVAVWLGARLQERGF